jgi:hypothetical protein
MTVVSYKSGGIIPFSTNIWLLHAYSDAIETRLLGVELRAFS